MEGINTLLAKCYSGAARNRGISGCGLLIAGECCSTIRKEIITFTYSSWILQSS